MTKTNPEKSSETSKPAPPEGGTANASPCSAPTMPAAAITFPAEVEQFFADEGHWEKFTAGGKALLQGLGVKLEPFGVPQKANPDRNDIHGFELLAYGPQATSYGQLFTQAKTFEVPKGILGIALFKVAMLTAKALVQVDGGRVSGKTWERLFFSINVDADMLGNPLFARLLQTMRRPEFSVLLEASEELQPDAAKPLRELLDDYQSWLGLALDDSDTLAHDTRTLLAPRVRLVKADGKYVQRLYRDRERAPDHVLSRLRELRQDRVPFVAEGVETKAIKNFLHQRWNVSAHGELWMQGYHIQLPPDFLPYLKPISMENPEQPKGYILPERDSPVMDSGIVVVTAADDSGDGQPDPDASADPAFEELLRRELAAILARHPILEASIAVQTSQSQGATREAVISALLSRSVVDSIDILGKATLELLRAAGGLDTENGKAIWHTANILLGWLCRRAANGERDSEAGPATSNYNLATETLCAVEVYVANQGGRLPTFKFTTGKADVPGLGAAEGKRISESGWNSDRRFEQLLVELQAVMFPAEILDIGRVGNSIEVQLKFMKSKLLKELKDKKTRNYFNYLPVNVKCIDPEYNGLLQRLVDALPGLTIVYYCLDSGTKALLVANEYDFTTAVRSFHEIRPEIEKEFPK